MKFRLGGWARVGVVLTVVWLAWSWLYADQLRHKAYWDDYGVHYSTCRNVQSSQFEAHRAAAVLAKRGDDWDYQDSLKCAEQAKAITNRTFGSDRVKLSEWWSEIWVVTAIGWLLAYLTIWIVRWVRRGFSPAQPHH